MDAESLFDIFNLSDGEIKYAGMDVLLELCYSGNGHLWPPSGDGHQWPHDGHFESCFRWIKKSAEVIWFSLIDFLEYYKAAQGQEWLIVQF